MRICIYKDNTTNVSIDDIVANLNHLTSSLRFQQETTKLSFQGPVISIPDSYEQLDKAIGNAASTFDEIFVFTEKPYDNNYFWESYGNKSIITLYGWDQLTNLSRNNGAIYLICAILVRIIGIRTAHNDNTGCIYDFFQDKTGVDVGMRAAFVCQTCINRFNKISNSSQKKLMREIELILNDLSIASRSNMDICDYWKLEKQKVVNKNPQSKRVFVVHGRNKPIFDSMIDFLRAIGLEPIEWSKAIILTKKPTPSIQEIVTTAFREAQAIIVLLTGDDIARLRNDFIRKDDETYEKQLTPQARPNVLFEAGMAIMGNQERTILVQIANIRKFSDIQGLHVTHLDDSPEQRMELINKLKNAGCTISDPTENRRWMTIGKFVDELNTEEKNEIAPSITSKPTTENAKRDKLPLPLALAINLSERIDLADKKEQYSLIDEFLHEYQSLLDGAIHECGPHVSLLELKDRGIPNTYFINNPQNKLKWVQNATERLKAILIHL